MPDGCSRRARRLSSCSCRRPQRSAPTRTGPSLVSAGRQPACSSGVVLRSGLAQGPRRGYGRRAHAHRRRRRGRGASGRDPRPTSRVRLAPRRVRRRRGTPGGERAHAGGSSRPRGAHRDPRRPSRRDRLRRLGAGAGRDPAVGRTIVRGVPRRSSTLGSERHRPAAGNVDDVWGVPLVQLRRPTTRSRNQLVKRCFDVVVASVLLVLTLPLLLVLAVAVRLSGPVRSCSVRSASASTARCSRS